ncbi:response regulator [Horticoccus sp. 23ND18S-11]|uniref:response regulator n=1 Tax=Horticoccus sp. 23ND18S-11 TaxID=3391832 RepID=UPI0039C9C673
MESRSVLIVEDDEDDFFLTQRAVRKVFAGPIVHLESGRAAIEYLVQRGTGTAPAGSDLVFLDLKMDDGGGLEVLDWVRMHAGPHVPRIFVLTGSNEPRDRERVRLSGVAAGYIVKPLGPEHLAEIFRAAPVG